MNTERINDTYSANAKINLFLEITRKRKDGYHSIDSIFQSVSLCDVVRVDTDYDEITAVVNVPGIPADINNTACKAAKAFFDAVGITSGALIKIEKHIPSQAGLGGGSADAAAVIHCLNNRFGTRLSMKELCEIGAKVGADVPFCIAGGCRRMGGFGEILLDTYPIPNYYVVIVKGSGGISTPSAYRLLDEMNSDFNESYIPKKSDKLIYSLKGGCGCGDFSGLFNIFEQTLDVLDPEALAFKQFLSERSEAALLSGSGSAVFALFDNEKKAQNVCNEFRKEFPKAFCTCCHTVMHGVETNKNE